MVTEMSCGQFIGCNNSFICAKINSGHLIESTHFKVRKSSHLGSREPRRVHGHKLQRGLWPTYYLRGFFIEIIRFL